MTFTDIIILVVVLCLFGLIIYKLIKNAKNDPCKGCPYAKSCKMQDNCKKNKEKH